MKNCIFDDSTYETIGFYKDLKEGLKEQAKEYIDNGDYEQANDMNDILLDLETYKESDELLVLSDNNGMGYTIREYQGRGAEK